MSSDASINSDDPMIWQKEVPYDTRQEAISDAITSFKICLTMMKSGMIKHFNVSFRSKKTQTSQVFRVNKKTFNVETLMVFPKRLKKGGKLRFRKRDKTKLLSEVESNFTILKTRPGHWYLCLPHKEEPPMFTNPVYKSVFLDPGVRTFQTFYSPDGLCGKIGGDVFNQEVKTLAARHDMLFGTSAKNGISQKTKRGLRKRCALLRLKIKNKVTDLHWQTASFLCSTFQNIFLPRFEVSKMVKGSPLGSQITRSMLQLSHGAFRERLLYYAKTKHRNIFLVGEQYTTKTCGACGHIQEMEGAKTFNCTQCQTKIDRDYNGARNICLKVLSQLY